MKLPSMEKESKSAKTAPLSDKLRDSVEYGIDQLTSLGDNVTGTVKDIRNNVSDFLSSADAGLNDIMSKAESMGKDSRDWLKEQTDAIFGNSSQGNKKKD